MAALPQSVKVRISSEAAGAITMTPVVSQVLTTRELVRVILSVTGKDEQRVAEVLSRGAVVQGASRFRWERLPTERDELAVVLATFPDPNPERRFSEERCVGVRLRAGRLVMEAPKQLAAQRRLLRRRSFWDALMDLASHADLQYVDYSYRTGTDEYRLSVGPAERGELHERAALIRHSGLRSSVLKLPIETIEWSVAYER
ncbi:MAG: hypothetical protein JSU00_15220 [Acidobacteria bacterium]|nr:hypothetical protein [Acidobacteriota bacterium]